MPELPEAETIVRGLRGKILGHHLVQIQTRAAKFFRLSGDLKPQDHLPAQVTKVFRHGKSVILRLRNARENFYCVIRLGMTGQLLLLSSDLTPREHAKHTHLIFVFQSNPARLAYRDPRQFGKVLLVREWKTIFQSRSHKAGVLLVPDPLQLNFPDFLRHLQTRRGILKAALIDQQWWVGIGNIYADEILFDARLHPRRPLETLTRIERRRLFNSVHRVLGRAVQLGGSSVSDYVNVCGERGAFQTMHRVYRKAGRRCQRSGCRGRIQRLVIASRGTHYCPLCQPAIQTRRRRSRSAQRRVTSGPLIPQ